MWYVFFGFDQKKSIMAKYRVAYDNKEVRSVTRTSGNDNPGSHSLAEDRTGQTIIAIVEAGSDAEAREKAQRLQIELQTGRTKRDIERRDDRSPKR